MEAVAAHGGSPAAHETVLGKLNVGIAKMNQTLGHFDAERQNACHGKAFAFHIGERPGEIHHAAALGIIGLPGAARARTDASKVLFSLSVRACNSG